MTMLPIRTLAAALLAGALGCGHAAGPPRAAPPDPGVHERVLDDFEDASAWSVVATDDVKAELRSDAGSQGRGLCVDYDFGRVTGYVALRRKLPVEFPAHFELGVDVRGESQRNALQIKFIDASGDNVWWMQRPEYTPPKDWQRLRVRQRQVEFAWGPTADRTLRRTETVEFVVVAGSSPATEGGKGSVCFDRFALRELPAQPAVAPAPRVKASPARAGADGAHVADSPPRGVWQVPGRAAGATLAVDYGRARDFSALLLRWRDGAAAPSRYTIELSDDGVRWRVAQRVERARGALQAHWLGDSESRWLRLRVPSGGAWALEGIEPLDVPTPNAFFAALAQQAPRGRYPRAYVGEQSYWTVLGVEGARQAALLSEDGVLEPLPGIGALEPLLVVDGRVLSWADAQIGQSLADGSLPMPRVHWAAANIELEVDAFGAGTPDAAQALARYRVRNLDANPHRVELVLAWRPFQANPPTQFLANPGGASELRELDWDGRALRVNGAARLQPLVPPDAVRIEPLAAGPVVDWATDLRSDAERRIDPSGYPSAALAYRLALRPGEQRAIGVALPLQGAPRAPGNDELSAIEQRVASAWRERLGAVKLRGGIEVQEVERTLRVALGHILVNRSGPALQPGARAYARSWIRDGAMTSSALLRMGRDDVARDFLRWYAPFQFRNGKVPCCATARGADPVPENDSHGEFAYAAADLWHYTHDAALARELWPHVRAAVAYMETLRQSQRTEANRSAERIGYYGLMPPSISHEGYSDKPAYSYWDDHWAYIGYRSAAELAQGLGLDDEAARIGAQRDEFRTDLLASIAATARRYRLDALAGAADRGDFDPTSSTIALSPGGLYDARAAARRAAPGEPAAAASGAADAASQPDDAASQAAAPPAADASDVIPAALLRNTWDRYWRFFVERRDSGKRWDDYTPYEWRNVGSFVRLGERERALQALRFFFNDRRPAGWRQWAEVVLRNVREPRFLGDMPHGWVASDHIRSVLDLFAYEHEGDRSLVLAAGVPLAWLQGEGVAIDGLRTPYGPLSWSVRTSIEGIARVATFELQPLREMPPGGIWLRGPWPPEARVQVDGRPVDGPADAIRLPNAPAKVRIEWLASETG